MSEPSSLDARTPVLPREVLVVEDDLELRDLMAELLEAQGFVVHRARDGAEGIEVLEREPGIALILLDFRLPTMDGMAFRDRQLHSLAFARIPVILVSGASDAKSSALARGAVAFLQKPFSPAQLLACVALAEQNIERARALEFGGPVLTR